MKKLLQHPLTVSVAGLVIGTLILYFVFGIGWSLPANQANVNGNGNATAVGENAQATINNKFPTPTIEYSTSSPAFIGNDGYIHQVYQLRFYYVLGTAPDRSFKISSTFINCAEPKGDSAPSVDNGRYYESSMIECWMKTPPPPGELLFSYSGQ